MNLLFFVLFAVVGGAIAYFADRLGRTLGKKRLSLMGMRPRHTAEFLTVVAGAVIPIITVFTVMALSSSVREWIFNSQKWKQERDIANKDLTIVRLELSKGNERLVKTNSELKKSSENYGRLQVTEKRLQDRIADTTRQLADRTQQLKTAQNQYTLVTTQYNKVKGQLTKVQGDYLRVQHLYASVNKDYGDLKKTLESLQTTYKSLQANFTELEKQRDQANKEVVADKKQVDLLTGQLSDLNSQLSTAKTAYAKTVDDYNRVTDQLSVANQDLINAMNTAKIYAQGFGDTRIKPAIFNVGEELARITIPPGTSQVQGKQYLEELKHMASRLAADRGAAKGNGTEESDLIPLPVTNGQTRKVISVAVQESTLLDQIIGSNESHVVIANALYTTMIGEFVPLTMSALPNKLVFHKGDKIAETWVRGELSNEQIFVEINNFAKTKVQPRARDAGMIGAQGHEASFGEVPAGEIFTLVSQLQKWGSGARLIAEAKQDTRAGDPLALKFDVQQR